MNVCKVALIKYGSVFKTPNGILVDLTQEEIVDVHGERNLAVIWRMLGHGKPIEEINNMICPNCLNLTGTECKCKDQFLIGDDVRKT